MDSPFKFSSLSKFTGLRHGVSTRVYGDMSLSHDDQKKVISNRARFLKDLDLDLSNVIMPEIVHGAKVVVAGLREKGRGSKNLTTAIRGCDGLVTAEKQVALMVTVADCFPIFAYDPAEQIIGLAHAGWRGIIAGITGNFIASMTSLGSRRENIVLGIGPGICQRHFIVKNDVLEKFLTMYPSIVFVRNYDGYVDLRKAILEDLKRLDIPLGNIEVSSICPVCQKKEFGSRRADGEGASTSAAVIGMVS